MSEMFAHAPLCDNSNLCTLCMFMQRFSVDWVGTTFIGFVHNHHCFVTSSIPEVVNGIPKQCWPKFAGEHHGLTSSGLYGLNHNPHGCFALLLRTPCHFCYHIPVNIVVNQPAPTKWAAILLPSMWPCKNTSHIQDELFTFLPTPHIKLKTRTTNRETTNSNPSGPIKLSSQSMASVRALLRLLPAASASCGKMLRQNYFAEPNEHVLAFLHPISFCWAT